MAIFKIYNDIQTEGQKLDAKFWGENEGVCFKDVNEFISAIPADDNTIDLRLHCNGGSVTEGWAMYDALRATGKEIEATIEGNCASMATAIYMAAPKERRKCMPSAHICLHNPYAFVSGAMNADALQKKTDELRAEQERLVNLYAERCGCDKAKIQALMDEDKFITAQEAYEMGIVGEILSPASASKTPTFDNVREHDNNNNQNTEKMAKENEKVEVKASIWQKIMAFFKVEDEEGVSASLDKGDDIKALTLKTADDETEITIERENGAPQVGDKASPDGTFEMPDGSTIKIEEGVIAEITPAKGDGDDEDSKDKKGDKDEGIVDDKEAEIEALKTTISEKDSEIADLKAQLETANAHVRTKEDNYILNAVKIAGGVDALAKLQSDYVPEQRKPSGQVAKEHTDTRAEKVNEIRDILKKNREKK